MPSACCKGKPPKKINPTDPDLEPMKLCSYTNVMKVPNGRHKDYTLVCPDVKKVS